MQHVATWKEGEEKWAYHDDAAAHIGTHKVSLDPYRLESRRILACIKDSLPAKLQKVEKASIDEVFLDLSAQVHSILLERYSELALPPPYDDPTENLPLPPTTALDWRADALVDLDAEETEEDDPDWDDIAMLIGSEIVRAVRKTIREKLKYTCSAGIAHNKMLSKLGSAHRKPNQQTVIRNRAVQQFLSGFKFTKIRNLGGKLGDNIVATFGTDTVKELLLISIEVLKQKLGDDSGSWVYQTIRGTDFSEVNSRTQIKSMLSAKSFRPSINTCEQAVRWLRIFVSDIYSRLVEEGVLENKRRPKTITLHHRQGGETRSRQAPIALGKTISEASLFDLAKALLNQIIQEGSVWPCANLSLSVGGFEDGVSGNMGIASYLVKGQEATAVGTNTRESDDGVQVRSEKRRRHDGSAQNIQRFFRTEATNGEDDQLDAPRAMEEAASASVDIPYAAQDVAPERSAVESFQGHHAGSRDLSSGPTATHQQPISRYLCNSCSKSFETKGELQSHKDWHFAKTLLEEDRNQLVVAAESRPGKKRAGLVGKKIGGGGLSKTEKGQSKLNFG